MDRRAARVCRRDSAAHQGGSVDGAELAVLTEFDRSTFQVQKPLPFPPIRDARVANLPVKWLILAVQGTKGAQP
jgi:hypothetical protein